MIITTTTNKTGHRVIVLGLTSETMASLVSGDVLKITSHTQDGFPTDLEILVCFGETELDLTEELQPLIGRPA